MLNQQFSRGAKMIRRFRQEALATAKTEHPNIVSVTDFGTTTSGQVYLVMELLQGETLLKVLRRDKVMTLSRAIPLLAAACHALDTVHKQGIVHRDLKPANIFLVPQEDIQRGRRKDLVKILDFGLAKVVQESLEERPISQSGKAYGTAGYMAPELLRGAEVTPSADIYSLGCIAFEMFAGGPVFTGKKPMSLAVAHCKQRAPLVRQRAPLARIPDALEQLIDRCLRKDPKQRVASCRELLEQLRELTRTLLTSEGTTRVETFGAPSRGGAGDGWRIDTTKQTWWEDFSVPVESPAPQSRASSGDLHSPGLDDPTIVDPRLALIAADEVSQTRDEIALPATPIPEVISEEVTDPRLRSEQLKFSAAEAPIRATSAAQSRRPAPGARPHGATAPRILLVEPDAALVRELRPRLVENGFLVSCDLDGHDVLRQVRRDPPDLLLLAAELHQEDGHAVCAKLKTDPALWRVPILLLPGEHDPQLAKRKGADTRADAYLQKPFTAASLLHEVRQLLERWRQPAAALRQRGEMSHQREQPPAPRDPPQSPPASPAHAGPEDGSTARPKPSTNTEPSATASGGNLTLPVPVLPAPGATKLTTVLIAALGLATLIVLGAALYLLLTGPGGRATLVLVITPAAAEARLDDRPLPQRGETRVLEEMPTGAHRLEVRHPGCQPARRSLALRRGKITVARIDLRCN